MKSLTRFACVAFISALSASAARADDFAPPFYRGFNGTVLVTWEFDAPITFAEPIAADTFSFVPSVWSPPAFYTTPRIIAPVPSDWAWNPDGSITAISANAMLEVVIPGYQGAWDGFARAQYTTVTDFNAPGAQLIPLGWGSSSSSILNFADARHASQDFIFSQFGSAQILRLFFSPGTGLTELVIDTHMFPVPAPGALALIVVSTPILARRRRVSRDER